MKKRKGYTLMELIVVMLIIAVLAVIYITLNSKQVQNANHTATISGMELIAADLDKLISDGNILTLASGETRKSEKIRNYLSAIEQDYLSFTFDLATLKIMANGFSIATSDMKDGFEQKLKVYISTDINDKRVLVFSCGVDRKDSSSTYSSGNFGDDIITIIKERLR